MKKFLNIFDRFEDKVRGFLSRYPTIYAIIAGIGIVLFWRGIWEGSISLGMSNFASILIGAIILLSTGIFVSYFVGDQIILSGIKGEKKIIERTKEELKSEENRIDLANQKLDQILEKLNNKEK